MNWSLNSSTAGRIVAAVCAVVWLFSFSCVHDITVPLQNHTPSIDSATAVIRNDTLIDTLFLPESFVCTLTVNDLNDTRLFVSSASWPGTFEQLDFGYGYKHVALRLDGNVLGMWQGSLAVVDTQYAFAQLPFQIHKMYKDTFRLSAQRWQLYDQTSGRCVVQDYDLFQGNIEGISIGMQGEPLDSVLFLPLGIRSTFMVADTFCFTVGYSLEGIRDGFTAAVFLSPDTFADTFQIRTDEAGIKLEGYESSLRMWSGAAWADMQPIDTRKAKGFLRFKRRDGRLAVTYRPETGTADAFSRLTEMAVGTGPLFVHINVQVSKDYSGTCRFGNFVMLEGTLTGM
jgi:hypothetical protein